MSPKIGRNDSCPCGSGKKYKKCCLAKDEREWREQAEYKAPWDTEIWYPKASDLQLPDVPENLRPAARLVLSRALPLMFGRGIGIRAGKCWQIAQALTLVTQGEIGYVEGVWRHSERCGPGQWKHCPCKPVPHAWNTYKGYTIDLLDEFFSWRYDNKWYLHEPLKAYTFTEVRTYSEAYLPYDITTGLWLDNGGIELMDEPDFHSNGQFEAEKFSEYVKHVVFKDACERLLARISGATRAEAA